MKGKWLISLALLLTVDMSAADFRDLYSHLNYGIEWGYTSTLLNSYHYNYVSSHGARVNSAHDYWTYKSNGHLLAFLGVKFAKKCSADVYYGWMGAYEDRRMNPLTLRGTYYINGYGSNGLKLFAEGGAGLARTFFKQKSYVYKAGLGERIMLGPGYAMDLSVSAQRVNDHPTDVYDVWNGVSVPDGNLRKSICKYLGVNFSITLAF